MYCKICFFFFFAPQYNHFVPFCLKRSKQSVAFFIFSFSFFFLTFISLLLEPKKFFSHKTFQPLTPWLDFICGHCLFLRGRQPWDRQKQHDIAAREMRDFKWYSTSSWGKTVDISNGTGKVIFIFRPSGLTGHWLVSHGGDCDFAPCDSSADSSKDSMFTTAPTQKNAVLFSLPSAMEANAFPGTTFIAHWL